MAVETTIGNFNEDQWKKIVEDGVAAGVPTGLPTPADLGSIDTSGTGADWTGVLNTGIKTVGDIIETGIDKGKQPPGTTPPVRTSPPTPGPQINVTLPQAPPPAANAGGANTALIVGGVVVGGLVLFVAASSLRKGRR